VPPPTVAGIERLLGAGDVLVVPVHPTEKGPARLGAGADVAKRLRIDAESVLRDHDATHIHVVHADRDCDGLRIDLDDEPDGDPAIDAFDDDWS